MRARALALAGFSALLVAGCTATVEGSASPAGGDTAVATGSLPDAAVVPGTTPEDAEVAEVVAPGGRKLAEDAARALEAAGSARMVGTLSLGMDEVAVDLRMHGDDLAGSLSVPDMVIEVVRIGDDAHMKAPPMAWVQQGLPASTAATLSGRWVHVPAAAVFGLGDTGLAGLAREVRSPGGTTVDDEMTAGEIDGVPVWLISAPDGTVTSVAAEGTPYPLYSATRGVGGGSLGEFGAVAPIVPPADFVEFDDLGD